MTTIEPPSPPYVGPPKWHGGGGNKPIVRIVMHCTAGLEPGVDLAARRTAAYTKNTDRPSSWHYCRDARETVQLTYDSVVAYHDGTNEHSIGYELCCSLSAQGAGHWIGPAHRAMLKGAAADVARLCLAYGVPIRRIRADGIRRGAKGICGHVDMRNAFPGSTTHWDPGPFFPWRRFMRLVRAEAERLTEPERVEFTVASLNIGDGPEDAKLRDLHRLSLRAQVIGLQEAGDRDALLRRFLAEHEGWALFTGTGPGAGKVPVLYDTRALGIDTARSRAVVAWGGGYVGPVGAGPTSLAPKVLTHATFTHVQTGRRVHVLNHHLIASHMRLGLPTRERVRRRTIAATQADTFERESEQTHGVVFGTGDWNAPRNWVAGHVEGFSVDNRGATFGLRTIDHIGHFPNRAVRVKGHAVMETSGSRTRGDHRAPLVTYTLTVK